MNKRNWPIVAPKDKLCIVRMSLRIIQMKIMNQKGPAKEELVVLLKKTKCLLRVEDQVI